MDSDGIKLFRRGNNELNTKTKENIIQRLVEEEVLFEGTVTQALDKLV